MGGSGILKRESRYNYIMLSEGLQVMSVENMKFCNDTWRISILTALNTLSDNAKLVRGTDLNILTTYIVHIITDILPLIDDTKLKLPNCTLVFRKNAPYFLLSSLVNVKYL